MEFEGTMTQRTDAELIKIVTVDRNGYEPSAIEAALAEIEKRKIDTANIEPIQAVPEKPKLLEEELKLIEEEKSFEVSSQTRFIHDIIDATVIALIGLVPALTFIYVLGTIESSADSFSDYLINFLNTADVFKLSIFVLVFFTVIFFGYYIFMEYKYQKTVAKFITKTKVVLKNGEKPKLGNIVKRTACRLIPFDAKSFLSARNGWHDKFSDTMVVKDE
ncbi:hypothetical protein AGMMS49938_19180 [Fibrobacterales bacterium]|nr:hypothetical protein AGMMS49938_19180 [Fibrobacterales bacterium]